MRGTVRKRGSRWYIIYDEGRDPSTGRRKQRWVSAGDTKKEAEAKLTKALAELNQGTYTEPSKVTVGAYLDTWLTDIVPMVAGPSTATSYEHMVRRHLIPGLGIVKLHELRASHIQKYLSGKLTSGRLDGNGGLSEKTVRHHYVTLHTALAAAIEAGDLAINPAEAVKTPKAPRNEMRTLDEIGLRRVLQAAKGTPYYALFYLTLYSGMRRSEFLALRWSDLDLERGAVTVNRRVYMRKGNIDYREPKSDHGRRQIPLPASATSVMVQHKADTVARLETLSAKWNEESLLFTNELGEPLHPDSITHAWMKLVNSLGLKGIRLHDARHTHASIMLRQGVNPKVVSERLGHSDVNITLQIYSHILPGLQEAAAAAFDAGIDAVDPSNEGVSA
jgi:integrase